MAQRSDKKSRGAKKAVGITHFAVDQEQNRQEKVQSAKQATGRGTAKPGVGGRGHRLSRTAAPKPRAEAEERFEAGGGKGGKAGGSRAGVLASRKGTKRQQ